MQVYGFTIRYNSNCLLSQKDYKRYNADVLEFNRVLQQTIVDNKICCVEVDGLFYFMSYNLAHTALDYCVFNSVDKNDLDIVYEASKPIVEI